MNLIQYITTEDKILSGENRTILEKLRPGLYPNKTEHWPHLQIILCDRHLTIINQLLESALDGRLLFLIDHDHPQLPHYTRNGTISHLLKILYPGKAYDFSELIGNNALKTTTLVISPCRLMNTYKDLWRDDDMEILFYEPYIGGLEDLMNGFFVPRILVEGYIPTKVIWHTENLSKDVISHGCAFLRRYFILHYRSVEVVIETFNGDQIELHKYLKTTPTNLYFRGMKP